MARSSSIHMDLSTKTLSKKNQDLLMVPKFKTNRNKKTIQRQLMEIQLHYIKNCKYYLMANRGISMFPFLSFYTDHAVQLSVSSPSKNGWAPCKTGPETSSSNSMAWLHLPTSNGFVQSQRNGCCACVSVICQVWYDPLRWNF